MRTTTTTPREQGFTLVELAIVLVIVGLLIGGILKGQELIGNTRINSVVTQVKAISTAINTFQDSYGGFPGDLPNAANRVPNCATSCAVSSAGTTVLGNGILSTTPQSAYINSTTAGTQTEAGMFFNQLVAAQLISGMQVGSNAGTNVVIGTDSLGSPISGTYYRVGYAPAGAAPLGNGSNPVSFQQGHYLALTNVIVAATAISNAAAGGLTPKQAEGVDRKFDDGTPNGGLALAINASATLSATTCSNGAVAASIYNTSQTGAICGLFLGID